MLSDWQGGFSLPGLQQRLNPCSAGLCSPTQCSHWVDIVEAVLILVLLDYALRRKLQTNESNLSLRVLILVLLDYALRHLLTFLL